MFEQQEETRVSLTSFSIFYVCVCFFFGNTNQSLVCISEKEESKKILSVVRNVVVFHHCNDHLLESCDDVDASIN
jgi:hypothetical protein